MQRTVIAAVLLIATALGSGCVGGSSEVTPQDKERLKAYILDQPPANIKTKLNINYENKITLLGCSVEPSGPVSPGQKVKLTMYWESKAAVGNGWNLFTHVLDGSGERILNIDNVGPLREWRESHQLLWPTAWRPGKVYVDEQEFSVPSGVRTRKLQIVTGVWRGNDRLKIVAGARDRENRGIVATLVVGSQTTARRSKSTRVPKLRVDRMAEDAKIEIDGKLDEPAWKSAPTTGPFVEVSTGEANRSAKLGGHAKLLWSEKDLFLGFDVRDTNVVGGFDRKAKDPHLWTKDTVEIMVDPDGDGDNQDYYEIQINPQNLVFDSRFDRYNQPRVEPDGPFGHQDWSARLDSAVVVKGSIDDDSDQDEGYVVEARISWESFDRAKSAPPKVGQTWRMNLYIVENNGGVAWSPILKQGNFHKASRFGRVLWAERGWVPPYASSPPVGSAARRLPSPRETMRKGGRPRPRSLPRPAAPKPQK